jgi:predicted flap endonuclease-1-like 5' DNA nuclease
VTRREAAAVVAVVLLILGGRAIRTRLLLDPDGAWRDPQWLADRLPDLPAPAPAAATDPMSRAAPATLSGPIDPNTCPLDSLLLLPGIGPALAGRIVAARAEGVHFATLADLRVVKGIGPKLSARLAPWLQFGPAGPCGPIAPAPTGPAAARVP